MRASVRWAAILVAACLTLGCRSTTDVEPKADMAPASGDDGWTRREDDQPGGPRSATPRLFSDRTRQPYLLWTEGDEEPGRGSLWLSSFSGREGWGEPQLVARGDDWFLNWADFPNGAALVDGTVLATWLVKASNATYAYHVWFSISPDRGRTWSKPRVLHDDESATEHGFVSLVAMPDEVSFGAVWLDGRATADGGPMQLRFRTIARDGTLGEETLLDDRVCDCCPTSLAALADGDLVCVYRDRDEAEIRDISLVRGTPGAFLPPTTLHPDGWEMPGCPVNGPAVATAGDGFAVAWYTGAGGGAGRVRVVFADGEDFEEPISIDEGAPAGRVDLAISQDGMAFVSWMEIDEDGASWRIRAIGRDGGVFPTEEIARISSGRESGVLQQTPLYGKATFFAWTDGAGSESRVIVGGGRYPNEMSEPKNR